MKMQFRRPELFDLVAVKQPLDAQPLEVGDVGAVVELLGSDAAEVEFLAPDGHTLCVATCPFSHLLLLYRWQAGPAD
jgi:catabolite regulation protein CreA